MCKRDKSKRLCVWLRGCVLCIFLSEYESSIYSTKYINVNCSLNKRLILNNECYETAPRTWTVEKQHPRHIRGSARPEQRARSVERAIDTFWMHSIWPLDQPRKLTLSSGSVERPLMYALCTIFLCSFPSHFMAFWCVISHFLCGFTLGWSFLCVFDYFWSFYSTLVLEADHFWALECVLRDLAEFETALRHFCELTGSFGYAFSPDGSRLYFCRVLMKKSKHKMMGPGGYFHTRAISSKK